MESTDAKSPSRINIKSWHWSIILFGFMLLYLLLGAFIFDATETQHSINAQNRLYDQTLEFFKERPCLEFDIPTFQEFGNTITDYLSQGASLKQEYWIDTEEETIETIWSLPRVTVFTLTVITTIGYGNIVPRTGRGKLFCVLYALIGIPLMGFTLSIFGKSLDGFLKRYKKGMDLLERPIKSRRPRIVVQTIITGVLAASTLILIPALLLSYFEAWPYFDSLYFFFITVSTIGFGDIYLDSCARCHRSVWIFVSLFTFYVFLGMCFITVLFRAFTAYQRRKFLEAESLLVTFLNTASSTIIKTTSNADIVDIELSERRDGDQNLVEDMREESVDSGTQDHEELTVDVHSSQCSSYPFVQAKSFD